MKKMNEEMMFKLKKCWKCCWQEADAEVIVAERKNCRKGGRRINSKIKEP